MLVDGIRTHRLVSGRRTAAASVRARRITVHKFRELIASSRPFKRIGRGTEAPAHFFVALMTRARGASEVICAIHADDRVTSASCCKARGVGVVETEES